MLYLEDYVEMIEHLPQELRDRFTELREMDLGVQNSVDSIEKKVKIFFSNAKKMKPNEKEAEYESIRKEYYKTLEDADEKVHLANQMYDLVERYLRRLDQELQKFKTELEADNRGITDILEKRSLELDQPPTNSSQKENRYNLTSSSSSRSRDSHSHSRGEKRRDSNASSTSMDKRVAIEKMPSSNSLPEARPSSANSGSLMQQSVSMPSMAASPSPSMANSVGPVSYNLGHIGAGGNAIAAAASQAIAATQHMQHGRRTASLKASYDAINHSGGVLAGEFSRELAGAAQTAIAAIQESSKKHKKKVSSSSVPNARVVSPSVQQQQQHQQQQQQSAVAVSAVQAQSSVQNQIQAQLAGTTSVTAAAVATGAAAASAQAAQITDAENPDWTYDPNEPRYCICNQVSYGDMVACDNLDCPFEWFHYPCVNITSPPKGKWYCPQCTSSMKRRGGRKN